MQTIGLLGGMSWESTALYYRWLNEGVKRELGGLHSARIAMVSVDFQEVEVLQHAGRWEEAGALLAAAAADVERAGADFLLICTNTMHKVEPQISAAIDIDVLHVADATAAAIKERGLACVGLLGTAFTMEESFYRGRLESAHGLRVVVPDEQDRRLVHDVIYDELCLGKVDGGSRDAFLRVIDSMREQGAQGVIEGCTEITMLVDQSHTKMPLFDTTAIHVEAAVRRALAGGHE